MHTKVKQETNNMQQYHYKQELKRSLKFLAPLQSRFHLCPSQRAFSRILGLF